MEPIDTKMEPDFSIPLMQSKIDVQNQLLTLMQTEIDMQNEKISSQDTQIKDLASKLEKLQHIVDTLAASKGNRVAASMSPKKNLTSDTHQELPGSSNSKKLLTATSAAADDATSVSATPLSVADMARETAETFAATSGFVYDESSGLYYDYSTGYYYDSTSKLYYNGHTRTYYTYDESTREYAFHSQLEPEEQTQGTNSNSKPKIRKKTRVLKHQATQTKEKSLKVGNGTNDTGDQKEVDLEEGEVSSTNDSDSKSDSDSDNSVSIIERPPKPLEVIEVDDSDTDWDTNEKENPPCIRAIVQKSEGTEPTLQKGSLYIFTCMGGTIGREGSNHTLLIPDPSVSKEHAVITYGYDEPAAVEEGGISEGTVKPPRPLTKKYFITDLGSQNGTFLNRNRLSPANVKSTPFEIQHGSTLQIKETLLLLHIHSGTKTCGHCEPGLVMEKEVEILERPVVLTKAQKESQRKRTLKKIRKRYFNGNLQTGMIPKLVEKYQDRADARRRLVGSDHDAFKVPEAEPASIHVPIDKQNKGFKMLQKMGWSEGESLGNSGESGLREPVKFEVKLNRAGLGAGSGGGKKSLKFVQLDKTVQRFFSISGPKGQPTNGGRPGQKPSKRSRLDVIELD